MARTVASEERKQRLQTYRKALGLTQRGVAERGGLDLQAITMLEGGYTLGIRVDRRRQYALGYGLPFTAFGKLLDGTITADAAVMVAMALDDAA